MSKVHVFRSAARASGLVQAIEGNVTIEDSIAKVVCSHDARNVHGYIPHSQGDTLLIPLTEIAYIST